MSEVVSIRFSPEEVAELKAAASAHGRKLSVHVHHLAMLGLLHTRPVHRAQCCPLWTGSVSIGFGYWQDG